MNKAKFTKKTLLKIAAATLMTISFGALANSTNTPAASQTVQASSEHVHPRLSKWKGKKDWRGRTWKAWNTKGLHFYASNRQILRTVWSHKDAIDNFYHYNPQTKKLKKAVDDSGDNIFEYLQAVPICGHVYINGTKYAILTTPSDYVAQPTQITLMKMSYINKITNPKSVGIKPSHLYVAKLKKGIKSIPAYFYDAETKKMIRTDYADKESGNNYILSFTNKNYYNDCDSRYFIVDREYIEINGKKYSWAYGTTADSKHHVPDSWCYIKTSDLDKLDYGKGLAAGGNLFYSTKDLQNGTLTSHQLPTSKSSKYVMEKYAFI